MICAEAIPVTKCFVPQVTPDDEPQFDAPFGDADRTVVSATEYTFANWAGSGVNATLVTDFTTVPMADRIFTSSPPSGRQFFELTFDQVVWLQNINVGDIDDIHNEYVYNFTPPFNSFDGAYQLGACGADDPCVEGAVTDGNGRILFDFVPVKRVSWSFFSDELNRTQFLFRAGFNLADPREERLVVGIKSCNDDTIEWVDGVTGAIVDPTDLVDCVVN